MEDKKTICYKINRSIEILETAIKTKELDTPTLANYLHEIRKSAQKMENALKARKKMMVENDLEEKYQVEHKKRSTPPGTNKIYSDNETEIKDRPEHEVTIKRGDEIVYQTTAFSGVICIAEEIEEIDEYGGISGQTQKYIFGHPLQTWFAFNQLEMEMEGKKFEIMAALKQAVESKNSPELRKRFLAAVRGGGS